MTRFVLLTALAAMMSLAQPAKASSTLNIAKKYIGLHERSHRKQLRSMMGFDPRSPWCGAFLSSVIRKAGKRPPQGSNLARSWLRYGTPVKMSSIRPGDIVVLGRKRGGHVGVFKRSVSGKICLVGGNQNDRIQETCYARSRILGVRRG